MTFSHLLILLSCGRPPTPFQVHPRSWLLQLYTLQKEINKKTKKQLKSLPIILGLKCISLKTADGQLVPETPNVSFLRNAKSYQNILTANIRPLLIYVPGNLHETCKNNSFLEHFRFLISAIMGLEKRLVVLPYPDRHYSLNC